MRTIIDLPDEQIQALADYCARERVSRAEAIRRAVNRLLADVEQKRADDLAAIDAAFGLWADRGIDTDTYLAELRAEWER
jgi:metal-responsive CopG/Arc/MetJ family transcriptional regulator